MRIITILIDENQPKEMFQPCTFKIQDSKEILLGSQSGGQFWCSEKEFVEYLRESLPK
jgi:hypothetical protein